MDDTRKRNFDILVNDRVLTTVELKQKAGEFESVEYPIPDDLPVGLEKVMIKFRSHQTALAGPVYECAILKRQQGKNALSSWLPLGKPRKSIVTYLKPMDLSGFNSSTLLKFRLYEKQKCVHNCWAKRVRQNNFCSKVSARIRKVSEFCQADLIAQGLSPFSPGSVAIKAGKLVLEQIHQFANREADFAFETTLSGKLYANLFKSLKKKRYKIHLFFLWIPDY